MYAQYYAVVLWWFLLTDCVSKSAPSQEAVYHYVKVESKPTQLLSHNYSTVELKSTHKENQPQYEMPIPQQHNIHKSNEVGKMKTVWGCYETVL